jgi:phosphoglucosamine mutase
MGKFFGTDGIRGQANVYPMDAPTALAVGVALGRFFGEGNQTEHIIIAQDTRISGDMLTMAVGSGICASGSNVSLAGVLPTPGLAKLVADNAAAAGVVISASHNPYQDNGIKVFNTKGYKLSEQDEDQIEGLIIKAIKDNSTFHGRIGRRMEYANQANHSYLDFLEEAVPKLRLDGLTLVLDCANGATFQTAPLLFERLGANVVALGCRPNGVNINDQCGSQHPENMAIAVIQNHADLGLAFDGDGDRLIAVDERGQVLSGDQIMAICAMDLQKKGKLKNNCVVTTVMSNIGFHQALKRLGIRTVATSVGDRFVMQKMQEEGAILGGEDSGHIIFNDMHTTGDGILAGLRLILAMKNAGRPLSEISSVMTVFPQTLVNVKVKAKPPLETVPEIMAAIAQVNQKLGDSGRVLVRYSGTENKCRVMVEGPGKEETDRYCQTIADAVSHALAN